MSVRHLAAAIAVTLGLAACQGAPSASITSAPAPEQGRVLAFAQGACGGCHAVENNALSPNPEAPEWPLIVNRPGLTNATLTSWLRDAHNYPEEMDFDLDVPQVEELVAYMLTLQSPDYEPAIQ
ncbi:hypothetical protein GCM10009127_28270 [Alteraurantiacibacter aestuarii]|uniref:Cytochrome c domain-containing protein n=1 Tax=Alteraurantiacibacter aestuarii TaxID=650004 RepID=A0A844ZQ66_9SPHN|nr:hypothetical protein [Alteraurantiacibacter aestuarii]MXO88937.1 hypothetical protein [Alteraurantiacibacter aestuarii]